MSYPIEFAQINLEFRSSKSNKFYVLTLLTNADGKASVMRRYGKIGGLGEIVIKDHGTAAQAEKEFEKLLKEKTGKGYKLTNQDEAKVADAAALRMKVGVAVWPKIPPSTISHLGLGVPTEGRRELDDTRSDEDGKFKGDPKPRTFSAEEIAAAKEAERQKEAAEAAQTYASNALYGRF